MASRAERVSQLLSDHGETVADELGLDLRRGTPGPLHGLLVASLLFSARVRAGLAVQAHRALTAAGLTSARTLAEADAGRVGSALETSGYGRRKRTVPLLQAGARQALEAYGGDLRRLREASAGEPEDVRAALVGFPGIGPVGADIFLREVQVAWPELAPYADARALATARELGLGDDAAALASLVDPADFPRLVAALVRAGLSPGA